MAKIDENTDGNEDAQAESRADGLGGGFESGGSLFGMAMALACENEQADGSENGGRSGVKEAFEGIDAEGIGDGNFVFARNEERADRFARTAQKKDGGESGQGHFIDVPKTGRPEILLEIPPADGAEEVAKINQDEGEKNVGEVGAFDGEPELLATEIAQIEEVAGAIEEEANQRSAQT